MYRLFYRPDRLTHTIKHFFYYSRIVNIGGVLDDLLSD